MMGSSLCEKEWISCFISESLAELIVSDSDLLFQYQRFVFRDDCMMLIGIDCDDAYLRIAHLAREKVVL